MRRALILLVLVASLAFAVLQGLHPYLAITRYSGGTVLVVEGWMEEEQMAMVADLVREKGYDSIYVTGTTRPSAYYLQHNAALDVVLRRPFDGEITVNMSGVVGSGFLLIADRDTLLRTTVELEGRDHRVRTPGPVNSVVLLSTNERFSDPDAANTFLLHLLLNDRDVHTLHREVHIVGPDGRYTPGMPTFAHQGAALLAANGLPEEIITIVPAFMDRMGRSHANAAAFALVAEQQGIRRFDVVSDGIHARRSRMLYRSALGRTAEVGVIALEDPTFGKDWWKHKDGRRRMGREITGLLLARLPFARM